MLLVTGQGCFQSSGHSGSGALSLLGLRISWVINFKHGYTVSTESKLARGMYACTEAYRMKLTSNFTRLKNVHLFTCVHATAACTGRRTTLRSRFSFHLVTAGPPLLFLSAYAAHSRLPSFSWVPLSLSGNANAALTAMCCLSQPFPELMGSGLRYKCFHTWSHVHCSSCGRSLVSKDLLTHRPLSVLALRLTL